MKILKKTVYKNKWFQIIDNHFIKSKKNYFTINMPDSSVILPVTIDNEFIIIKQYPKFHQKLGSRKTSYTSRNCYKN